MVKRWRYHGISNIVRGNGCQLAITAFWYKGDLNKPLQLVEQQAGSDARLAQSRGLQLQSQLTERNQELEELDDDRDRLTHEIRQMHGRLAALLREDASFLSTAK